MDDVRAAEVTKALNHPLRIGYVRALAVRGELSPTEFAGEIGQPLGNVAYHVKALFVADVLKVSSLVPRRGAVEHRYSLTGKNARVAKAIVKLLAKA